LKYRIVTKDTFLTANVRLVAKLVVRRKHIGLIELNKVRYSVTQIYDKPQICLFVGHTGFIAQSCYNTTEMPPLKKCSASVSVLVSTYIRKCLVKAYVNLNGEYSLR